MTARTSRKSNPEPLPVGDPGVESPFPTDEALRAFALRLLARREYGRQELMVRMIRKFEGALADEARIADCVDRLVGEGLVSDRRFAESFVRARGQRGQGPLKIRAELQQRRVDFAAITDSLHSHDETWTDRAVAWLRRHAPAELDRDSRAKFYRRLTSRGFSHQQAMDALDRWRHQTASESQTEHEGPI